MQFHIINNQNMYMFLHPVYIKIMVIHKAFWSQTWHESCVKMVKNSAACYLLGCLEFIHCTACHSLVATQHTAAMRPSSRAVISSFASCCYNCQLTVCLRKVLRFLSNRLLNRRMFAVTDNWCSRSISRVSSPILSNFGDARQVKLLNDAVARHPSCHLHSFY